MNSVQKTLGLTNEMSTYFSHAPSNYFSLLEYRTYTHRPDDDGTYDFMHAFFKDKDQLEASLMVLASKLGENGIFWISWPTDKSTTDINYELMKNLANLSGLIISKKTDCIPGWETYKLLLG